MPSSARSQLIQFSSETYDKFTRYLASCTPPLPAKPREGADDVSIKHYKNEALKLFCILTKRSFFITLDDTERNILQELLLAFEMWPQDQEVHLDALKKFANLAFERGWDHTGAAYELVELADSIHVGTFGPKNGSDEEGEDTDDEYVAKKIDSVVNSHAISLPRAQIPALSEPGALDQYGPVVQDCFFALAKVARVRPLFVPEKVEFEFFRAMLRFVDGSYENHKRYNTIYDQCISRNFSPPTEMMINEYTPWATRCPSSTKAAQKRPAEVELARSDKVKTAKLEVSELGVMNRNETSNEETSGLREDAMIDNDEKADNAKDPDGKTSLSLITKTIADLGTNATEAGAILVSIREHARSGIYIGPRPLYHTSDQTKKKPLTPPVFREGFGSLNSFFKKVTRTHELWLGLVITPVNYAVGVSHERLLSGGNHAVVVGVIYGRNSHSRALLVWDVHVVDTDRQKSKASLHKKTLAAIERARQRRRHGTPKFYSFWINNGVDVNDSAISLRLSLEQILSMAVNGLDIRWGDDDELVSIGGFQRVDDTG
ncbi:hypothetical protein MSAN_00270300 [Mycena sanguinolenta]|uniref:Uncharacterized protein n=1 Tax=Mycena sanguinolenta TaxID=230812 RepID=A0A8H6ZJ28_9AGAR|nr:hypothetical protein MSAN_00270300 [Mycena sanguinolenta]